MKPLIFDHETLALQSSSKAWWDEGFTRMLLEAIPAATRHIVEIGCGAAHSAHVLLPALSDAQYVGINAETPTVKQAQAKLIGTPFCNRASIRLGQPEDLPLPDGVTDLVLGLMTLQHCRKVEKALSEIRRVLRPQGRVVLVEPDNLGQRFYFDGVLEEINQSFHRVCLRARVARQPADIALGPRVAALLQSAGFTSVTTLVHAVHSSTKEDAKSFFARLKKICHRTAKYAGLPPETEELQAFEQAVNRSLYAGLPKRVGYSTHLVPVFRVVGKTP